MQAVVEANLMAKLPLEWFTTTSTTTITTVKALVSQTLFYALGIL